jgi:AcrR family transcriptional regulator
MFSERAGLHLHTLYAHFPDERSLLSACSGQHMERDPLPDAEPWRGIANQRERLRTGLLALYRWYARNAELAGRVLRDAEHHTPTREIATARFGPAMGTYHEVLGAKLRPKQRAVLQLALSFFTWRTLARDGGLKDVAAVDVMIAAIECAG